MSGTTMQSLSEQYFTLLEMGGTLFGWKGGTKLVLLHHLNVGTCYFNLVTFIVINALERPFPNSHSLSFISWDT